MPLKIIQTKIINAALHPIVIKGSFIKGSSPTWNLQINATVFFKNFIFYLYRICDLIN